MLDVKEIRNKIVCLLRDYPVMCRKIALLRYEWEHPCEITESEMLNAMAYSQKRTDLRSPVGHVSDKTYHTAVNYRDQAAYCNREEAAEIEAEITLQSYSGHFSFRGVRKSASGVFNLSFPRT